MYTVQEILDKDICSLNETIERIKQSLIDRDYSRNIIRGYPHPYQYTSSINDDILKLKSQKDKQKYKKKFETGIQRFNSIFNIEKDTYTQLVTFELMHSLSEYEGDVRVHSYAINIGKPGWGEHADGGFSDCTLTLREYIEEVISGIKLLNHSEFYPWLTVFLETLNRYNEELKVIIESETTHYVKINAIRIPPEYLEWFSKPYWWRELELKIYNEVKNK